MGESEAEWEVLDELVGKAIEHKDPLPGKVVFCKKSNTPQFVQFGRLLNAIRSEYTTTIALRHLPPGQTSDRPDLSLIPEPYRLPFASSKCIHQVPSSSMGRCRPPGDA